MSMISFLPLLVLFGGVYFTVALRGFQIFGIKKILRVIKSHLKSKCAVSSLILALAGTLGVGNVTGVAVGIAIGGAGSVFWLIISSLFSSPIKYCEVALATDMADGGGMSTVIKKSFGKIGAPLSCLYCALCLALSFALGGALQSGSIGECASTSLGISPYYLIIPLGLFIVFVTSGGAEKIENAVKIIIPLTTLLYIAMCLCVIIPNINNIPDTLYRIVSSAFDFRAASGGVAGFFTSRAVKEGFARGMLSNEAGAGTSTLAHSRAGERDAVSGGVFGMLEVFFDTVVLCPLTAFALLLTGCEEGGISALLRAFSGRLPASGFLLFLCVFFFALSTVLCWFFYGESCLKALFPRAPRAAYLIPFTVCACGGLVLPTVRLIPVCDMLLMLMTAITLLTLIKNTRRIRELSKELLR